MGGVGEGPQHRSRQVPVLHRLQNRLGALEDPRPGNLGLSACQGPIGSRLPRLVERQPAALQCIHDGARIGVAARTRLQEVPLHALTTGCKQAGEVDEVEAGSLTGDPPDSESAYRCGRLTGTPLGHGDESVQVRITDVLRRHGRLLPPAARRPGTAPSLQGRAQLIGRRRRTRDGKGREGRERDRRVLGKRGQLSQLGQLRQLSQNALAPAQLVGERHQVGALGAEADEGPFPAVAVKEEGDRLVGSDQRARSKCVEESPAADIGRGGRSGPDIAQRLSRSTAHLLRPVDTERSQDQDQVGGARKGLLSGADKSEPVPNGWRGRVRRIHQVAAHHLTQAIVQVVQGFQGTRHSVGDAPGTG